MTITVYEALKPVCLNLKEQAWPSQAGAVADLKSRCLRRLYSAYSFRNISTPRRRRTMKVIASHRYYSYYIVCNYTLLCVCLSMQHIQTPKQSNVINGRTKNEVAAVYGSRNLENANKWNPLCLGHPTVLPPVLGINALEVIPTRPNVVQRPFWNVRASIVVLLTQLFHQIMSTRFPKHEIRKSMYLERIDVFLARNDLHALQPPDEIKLILDLSRITLDLDGEEAAG